MKKPPEIKPLTVPDHVFVNMHNGQDFVPVPLSNLDQEEVRILLLEFIAEFADRAGLRFDITTSMSDKNFIWDDELD